MLKKADEIYTQACVKLYRGVKAVKGIIELIKFEMNK